MAVSNTADECHTSPSCSAATPWAQLTVYNNSVVGGNSSVRPKTGRLSALKTDCELFVAPNGSDSDPGTLGGPFRTVHHALARAQDRHCTITLRSGTYELDRTLEIAGPSMDDTTLRTHAPDLAAGMPAAVLSGGRRIRGASEGDVWRI